MKTKNIQKGKQKRTKEKNKNENKKKLKRKYNAQANTNKKQLSLAVSLLKHNMGLRKSDEASPINGKMAATSEDPLPLKFQKITDVVCSTIQYYNQGGNLLNSKIMIRPS